MLRYILFINNLELSWIFFNFYLFYFKQWRCSDFFYSNLFNFLFYLIKSKILEGDWQEENVTSQIETVSFTYEHQT